MSETDLSDKLVYVVERLTDIERRLQTLADALVVIALKDERDPDLAAVRASAQSRLRHPDG